MPKLTDEQIVEAFKNCFMKNDTTCEECPAFDGKCNATSDFLISQILDLINRLKADNERLTKENNILSKNADTAFQDGLNEAQNLYAEQIRDKTKIEAYKEFVEKTNEMITEIYNKHIFGNNDLEAEEKDAIINFSDDVVCGFDNLVKEMVGEG